MDVKIFIDKVEFQLRQDRPGAVGELNNFIGKNCTPVNPLQDGNVLVRTGDAEFSIPAKEADLFRAFLKDKAVPLNSQANTFTDPPLPESNLNI